MRSRSFATSSSIRRVVALVPVLLIAAAYAAGAVNVTGVQVYLVLLGVAALVLTVSPSGVGAFLQRLQKVSVGPVSADLQASAASAASAATAASGAATDREEDPGTGESLLTLRMDLQWKIAELARQVLTAPGVRPADATFVTVGYLLREQLLDASAAHVADAILTTGSLTGNLGVDTGSHQAFLDSAVPFVRSFRVTVFYAVVRQTLEHNGAAVDTAEPSPNSDAPDRAGSRSRSAGVIKATIGGAPTVLLPLYASGPESALVQRHLEGSPPTDPPVTLVLPINTPGTDPDRARGVLTLEDLRRLLRSAQPRGTVESSQLDPVRAGDREKVPRNRTATF